MPRQPRLDVPGLLNYVMARGIERRDIFKDNKDRKAFLERLATVLEETQTQCYAWALIPNHFHLLLRTVQTPLSKVMRRLMTGYALTFNKRHKRSGHLFQNRYKSIVCEEDPYLLELIRYIHLNPIRAGLVKDLRELDKYPWTGHSVILGRRKNPLIPEAPAGKSFSAVRRIAFSQFHPGIEKTKANPENPARPVKFEDHFTGVNHACPVAPVDGTGVKNKSLAEKTVEDILLNFGDTVKVSRRRYRQFVNNGIDQGKRPELQGGGLVRPACHARAKGLLNLIDVEKGNGTVKKQMEVEARAGRSAGGDKTGLLGRKKEEREKEDDLRSPVKRKSIVEAKSAFGYIAIKQMGYSGREVGRFLNMRSYSAIRRPARFAFDSENNFK